MATAVEAESAKDKSKAKKRYLKRKKERRKNRKSAAPKKPFEASKAHVEASEESSSSDSEDGDADSAGEPTPEQLAQEDLPEPEVPKRPKKRRKTEKEDDTEDVEMKEAEVVPVDVTEPPTRRSPSPVVALPSFPLPALPNAPSKSVLALQGLDQALVDAEIVDPSTLLPIPCEGEDDAGTGLSEKTRRRLKELGIVELFADRTDLWAVQTALLPFLLPQSQFHRSLYLPYDPPRDVCASAPTGSGKTLAYVLPIVELLSARIVTRLRALVVLPTRDLVTQVRETFEAIGKGRGLKIGTATGQHSFAHEQSQLIADSDSRFNKVRSLQGGSSKVDILICTPGRLIDHINGTPNFSLQHLRFLLMLSKVIDEADRLLAQSFQDWLAQVLAATRPPPLSDTHHFVDNSSSSKTIPRADGLAPAFLHLQNPFGVQTDVDEQKVSSCQKLLFSATLTRDPGKVAALELRDPKYFIVQEQSHNAGSLDIAMEKFSMPASLTEHMIICESAQKPLMLFHLVHTHKITNALVFTKSAESTTRLVRLFEFFETARASSGVTDQRKRIVIRAYSSDAGTSERKSILDSFKAEETQILVCSDVISRGMDISHVSHVVSYDSPVDMRKYVHRVGRTARAGRAGDAWTLVEEQEARYFKAMLKAADHLEKVKRLRVSDKDIAPLQHDYETVMSSSDLHKEKSSDEGTVKGDVAPGSKATPGMHRFSRFAGLGLKNPPPPKESVDDSDMIPEATAGWLSLVTFQWITPLLTLGYARPLEAPDLYKLQDDRAAAYIADRILASFDARRVQADEFNVRLANGDVKPGWRAVWWAIRGNKAEREKKWREKDGKKHASLALAMNDSVKWWFWSGGILKVIGDTAQVTSPLVVKAIVNFATQSYADHRTPGGASKIPAIGKGIGLAFCLFILQIIASLCTHHFFYRSTSTGVLLRGGLITAIYNRSLKLSARARGTLTNGKLVNHISTDVSRIDFCCGFFHMSWAAPIQMTICLILLLLNLGVSALAGFGFLILLTPMQTVVMKRLFKLRQASMQWTDKRAKLLQELLGGMKIIKFFAWEQPFLKRIIGFRQKEMAYVRSLLLIRSGNNALAMSLPVLASVLSFVTYSLLAVSLSAIADASNAVNRLTAVFEAEIFTETQVQDPSLSCAIEISGAEFSWDTPPPQTDDGKMSKRAQKKQALRQKKLTAPIKQVREDIPFTVKRTDFEAPRGQLIAIVGPVGAGKTSLLQGLIGEMRRTSGSVKFGGSVSYCPQSAWIQVTLLKCRFSYGLTEYVQNATIRDNICFGRPFEAEKYWKVVHDACLEPDLDMLGATGDLTEVGEKGISLSGGQKQRINIARAIYCDADVQIFDDPLSALDAHVGKAVFEQVLRSNSAHKTRILVTHALHFLPQVDYILTIVDGRIAERGTYLELMAKHGEFSKFITEFGSAEEKEEKEGEPHDEIDVIDDKKVVRQNATRSAGLMQTEERNTGHISGDVYKVYLRAGKGNVMLPLLLLSVVLIQGSTVMSSYCKWNQTQAFYMGIYAGLGVSQAIFAFAMGASFALLTYYASQRLHRASIERVMHAPTVFFETTPLGRIMNRFSKDIDTIDNLLGDSLRMFASTLSSIFGAIILITIVLPYFLVGVAVISCAYVYAAIFYRASARELKRLDAILRSSLYSHFSESLSGLATIRAYGETNRFKHENEERVDIENRVVAIMTVATRFTISPAQTGLFRSDVENNMNSVERVVHYATAVEQEAAHNLPADADLAAWPTEGQMEFNNVVFKYRPELPPVLKGVTMSIAAGEKIGIVGRTGAGKSSIMTALYRLVELSAGKITIDGVDISTVGLSKLRSSLSIIPQDPLLFSGTLRTNLDPFGLHDDARLWDALKRSYLVEALKDSSIDVPGEETIPSGAATPVTRFTLDSPVEDEGGNLSIGQPILASVDYETDRQIQDTIATEFADRTILCIAHRLRTIISYDRVLVLDAGQIAEFDTPTNLYKMEGGIFRGMCDRSSISWDDIRQVVKELKIMEELHES
ncbi:hypothetical protein HWV62_6090 [Athelia sp. TMB]|nr:hypothetical protein HWV62_6090 [Athelia sp. TMB]